MVLELRISGPGLDVKRRIARGDEPLVLGRDPECDVCLPDPERTVSRRHLELWVEDGDLHFHVLSVVNGIEMHFGEAPPGARGVLPAGQAMKVGDYGVTFETVDVAPPAPARDIDPWAVFDRDASGIAPAPPERLAASAGPQDDDPFSDWGFESTFNPDAPPESPGQGDASAASPFFRGLGLAGAHGAMTQAELESIGRLVRVLVLGVFDLHSGVAGVKEDLRSEDRTMLAPRETNPLRSSWSDETKLRYLFGGRLAAAGLPPPERALREILIDLVAHNAASGHAARSAIESTLKEFAPEHLKSRLLGDGPKLFEGKRAWDAYCRHFEEHGADLPGWGQRLLEKYFTEAYMRESARIRRGDPPRDD